jgi:hypothetical protein
MTPYERDEWSLRGYGDYQSTLKDYFSPGGLFKSSAEKADSSAMEDVKRKVGNAFYSDDAREREQPGEFASLLKSLPLGTRNEWNTSNTLNTLADSNGIGQLLSALRELIEVTKENRKINLTVEN